MQSEMIRDLLMKVKPLQSILVATASADKVPHVGTATMIDLEDSPLLLEAWLCSQTLMNLEENKIISVILLSERRQQNYQIIGDVQSVENSAVLDGFVPGEETRPIPQVRVRLHISIKSVLRFEKGPHYDVELPQVMPINPA